ncbi:MAG: hypothetical protein ACMVO3_08625 [Thalassobaculum sp.]
MAERKPERGFAGVGAECEAKIVIGFDRLPAGHEGFGPLRLGLGPERIAAPDAVETGEEIVDGADPPGNTAHEEQRLGGVGRDAPSLLGQHEEPDRARPVRGPCPPPGPLL